MCHPQCDTSGHAKRNHGDVTDPTKLLSCVTNITNFPLATTPSPLPHLAMSDPLNTASSNLYDFLSPLPPTTIPTHISPLERRRHADKTRRSSTFARLTSFDDECEVQNHKTKLPARGHRSTEPRNAQRHRAHRSLSPKRSTATTATKATGVAGAPFRAFNKSQSSVL